MTVKGSMVTLLALGSLLLSACNHDLHGAQAAGPGASGNDIGAAFYADSSNLTCVQLRQLLSNYPHYEYHGRVLELVDTLGDQYVLSKREATPGRRPDIRCWENGRYKKLRNNGRDDGYSPGPGKHDDSSDNGDDTPPDLELDGLG